MTQFLGVTFGELATLALVVGVAYAALRTIARGYVKPAKKNE